MSKLKKIVLFSGIGVIALAVIIITSVSLIKYQVYRSNMEKNQTEVVQLIEI